MKEQSQTKHHDPIDDNDYDDDAESSDTTDRRRYVTDLLICSIVKRGTCGSHVDKTSGTRRGLVAPN